MGGARIFRAEERRVGTLLHRLLEVKLDDNQGFLPHPEDGRVYRLTRKTRPCSPHWTRTVATGK